VIERCQIQPGQTTTPSAQGCRDTFTFFNDTNYAGGSLEDGANSEELCKQACSKSQNCTGADYDPVQNGCYSHKTMAFNTNREVGNAPGVRQFAITRCNGTDTQTTTLPSNQAEGRQDPTTTLPPGGLKKRK
jgi:hypothetical protein